MIPEVKISDYSYDLPDGRIAKFPLEHRDDSKLLCYREGVIEDHCFRDITGLLPGGSMMVFNETKVVPARMFFERESGARVEIFCLEPLQPSDYVTSFDSVKSCVWKCVVGNVKRCKVGEKLILSKQVALSQDLDILSEVKLTATILEKNGMTSVVRFEWESGRTFAMIMDICGRIPIPPYLNRDTQEIDIERYQTSYAIQKGSVAAPTAGLHFTKDIMEKIAASGIDVEKVCLHVGAGTFLPVKSEEISGHKMHREPFIVTTAFLSKLRKSLSEGHKTTAVGTTSVRTLESLYYAGVKVASTGTLSEINQWEPYEGTTPGLTAAEAIGALEDYAVSNRLDKISLGTSIIIVPGYKFHIVDVLVTNFHQPQSTLLLLISAFVDGDWRSIYDHALAGSYRFLSYGDSSILFRKA